MITPRQAIVCGLLCAILGCGEKPRLEIKGPHILEVDFVEAKDPTEWGTRQWKTYNIVVHGERVYWDTWNDGSFSIDTSEVGGLWRIRVDEDKCD